MRCGAWLGVLGLSEVLVGKGLRVSGRAEMGTMCIRIKMEYGRSWVRWQARMASTCRTVFMVSLTFKIFNIISSRTLVRKVSIFGL